APGTTISPKGRSRRERSHARCGSGSSRGLPRKARDASLPGPACTHFRQLSALKAGITQPLKFQDANGFVLFGLKRPMSAAFGPAEPFRDFCIAPNMRLRHGKWQRAQRPKWEPAMTIFRSNGDRVPAVIEDYAAEVRGGRMNRREFLAM